MHRTVLLLLLTAGGCIYAQDVVKVNRPYVLLDLPASSGIAPGTLLPVQRRLPSGARVTVGSLKILFSRDTVSAALIVDEDRFLAIREGDRLLLHPQSSRNRQEIRGAFATVVKSPWISISAAGLGLVSGGLAWYYYDRAGTTADTRPVSAAHYLKLSEKVHTYDNRSNLFQGIGVGLIVFSALHYIFIHDASPAVGQGMTIDSWQEDGALFTGLRVTIPDGL